MPKVTLFILLVAFSLARLEKPPEMKPDTSMKMSNNAPGSDSDDNVQTKMEDINLMMIMITCNESFRIEMSYLEALNNSGSFPDETDRNPKCYLRCVLENTGVMSEDGKIDTSRTAQVWYGERSEDSMSDIQEIVTTCSERNETCKCEKAYQYMKCLMEMEIAKSEKTTNQKSDKH